VTNQLQFDESASRAVEAAYTTPDLVKQRARVLNLLAPCAGERVLDIGCGPGFLVHDLAGAVGATGHTTGLDNSASMLALALHRCRALANAHFANGDALSLPFDDDAFDAAVVTQVYEYVPDIEKALGELRRVVRPGGRALILDTDWSSIVWRSSDDARSQRILAAWDEHLADPHLPRTLAPRLRAAGFADIRVEIIPMLTVGRPGNTFSEGLVGFIEKFVPGRAGVTPEETAAWAADLRALGERNEYFFSLNRYVFLAT